MTQRPGFCVIAPNPALDRILTVEHLQPGTARRVTTTHTSAGGKGLNVARAARTLNINAPICAPLGGLTGQQVAWLAAQEGLSLHVVPIGDETRVCTLIVDSVSDLVTVLNETGPKLNPSEWHALTERILAVDEEIHLICGSLPPNVPPEMLTNLIQTLHARNRRVLVDTSGPALAAAVAARPDVVKINGEELGALLGMTIGNVATAQQAVTELHQRGIAVVVVTLGAQGAVGIDDQGGVIAIPPAIPVRNPIGCGDSFFAGLAVALSNRQSLDTAMRLASACAVADALTLAPGLIEEKTVSNLLNQIGIGYW
ncbi:1-phosphofructokinase family hexose kinase [Chloroflexus sp.]|uniref:1-phosphofructokinase family hexose kinase n=1 Tax=Chloroflexus sp. TaxID=1904827 RepID=UPI002620056A|nr:hexose kinase [uncultured Chloroflexus sp.]